ncbi:oxidoreductase, partial [Vibrio astriarenae]
LPTTEMTFILRNVRLQAVDSVTCPTEKRFAAWEKLVELLPESNFEQACTEATLEQAPKLAEDITNGQLTGRVVIKL